MFVHRRYFKYNVEFDFMGSFQKMGVHIFSSAQLRQLGALQSENKSIGMIKLYSLFCVWKIFS